MQFTQAETCYSFTIKSYEKSCTVYGLIPSVIQAGVLFLLQFLLLETQSCLSPCVESLLKLSKLIPGKQ